MAKRLTEKQKEAIIKSFLNGKTIDLISQDFKCTKLTITRNLKKDLGDHIYKETIEKNKKDIKPSIRSKKENLDVSIHLEKSNKNENNDLYPVSSFIEIAPLEVEIENSSRKELSSIPISEVEFPKIVYMIVNNQIDLEIKLLKDYPDWQFLPINDLNRKTISIYNDLNTAKRFCKKDQKVIKVPNTNVFRIVAPILISRGISRIVNADTLIAL